MSDANEVTVRLTEAGPVRIRGNGKTWERGETRTLAADHAATLCERVGFEAVDDGEVADREVVEFDAASFVDRTPMADVIAEIEAGKADSHLEAVATEASRQGVMAAVEDRTAALEEADAGDSKAEES